jgi:hypothetical protein
MRNGNGSAQQLLELLTQQQQPPSKEDRVAAAIKSFNNIVKTVVEEGCPGAKEDPDHAARDNALVTMLKTSHTTAMLPEPIVDAVMRLLALEATHGQSDPGDGLRRLFNQEDGFVATCLLVAGVTLKVVEDANKQGIKIGTGQYL